MIGIAALLVGIGVLWVCFAYGVYLFMRTGREGLRIQRMEDERVRSRAYTREEGEDIPAVRDWTWPA